MQLTTEEIQELEKTAELNDGHCDKCHQTIKIYRYKISKSHAQFLKAMANAVHISGKNNVDISTLELAYSVRTQVTKIRQHGLIARIKNDKGNQVPRHWLITHKGWAFLNGGSISSKVVVFNNQVLGHDGGLITIYDILGERFDPLTPVYEETPIGEPESRIYEEVRIPQRYMIVNAIFRTRDPMGVFKSQKYELQIKRLQVGRPVEILGVNRKPTKITYNDLAAFQKKWKIV